MPTIGSPTAIGTLVAHYYILEVSLSLGFKFKNDPRVLMPIFICKGKGVDQDEEEVKAGPLEGVHYINAPLKVFPAALYLFKKNLAIPVFNFKEDDRVTINVYSRKR